MARRQSEGIDRQLEQATEQYNVLRGIEDLSGLSLGALQGQLAAAIAAEEAARVQIAGIQGQLAWHERQYNALMGIGSGITDLSSAMRAFAAGQSAVREAQAQASMSREERYMANNPDVANAWAVNSYGLTADEFARMHYERHGKREGRSFDVGTSYVPYDMMANIHRGEIIIDPRSSDILRNYGIEVRGGAGGGNSEAEQRRTNEILTRMERRLAVVERSTEQLAEQFDQVTEGANAMRGVIMEPVEVATA